MDAGIVDTINREDARKITARLDGIDAELGYPTIAPWYLAPMSRTLLGGPGREADRAWFVGQLAALTPGVRFDGFPADCDWDNFYGHLQAEILARRCRTADCDPETPPAEAAETQLGCVV